MVKRPFYFTLKSFSYLILEKLWLNNKNKLAISLVCLQSEKPLSKAFEFYFQVSSSEIKPSLRILETWRLPAT